MQAFSVNDDHAHNCCQAQCLVLCQLKIVKTQNRNQSVFTPVTVVSPPSHLGESHFLFLIHIHTTRYVHKHSVFTCTVCSHTQCVHIHSVFTYTVCSHAQCYIHLHVTHIVLHTDTKLVLPTYKCLFFLNSPGTFGQLLQFHF